MSKYVTFSVRNNSSKKAVILLHGFNGRSHDTFGMLPAFLAGERRLNRWDLHCFGYPTSLSPDITGIWSADPDLSQLSKYFAQQLKGAFGRYKTLALIAHSMGGLIVQRALLHGGAAARVKKVMLFGTPSAGLRKASLFKKLFKRQVTDMEWSGKFITDLRKDWTASFSEPSFDFCVVAGLSDQFVPPESSLTPFAEKYHRHVPGNHLEMVKPMSADAENVRLIVSYLLSDGKVDKPDAGSSLTINGRTSTKIIAEYALTLELSGQAEDAIKMLEQHRHRGHYLVGTLAGRYKRQWLATLDREIGLRALECYREGFGISTTAGKPKPAAYHAINMAFLFLALENNPERAREMAKSAMRFIEQAPDSEWYHPTRGEAQLHLGRDAAAIKSYREVSEELNARERASMFQQAIWTARLLKNEFVEAQLSSIMILGG